MTKQDEKQKGRIEEEKEATERELSELVKRREIWSNNAYITFGVEEAKEMFEETRRFINESLKENIDYELRGKGKTKEKSLLKPGAEKLAFRFKLRPEFDLADKLLDWERGLFYFQYVCRLVHVPTGVLIAQYVASCNTWEEKYRYRWLRAKDLPPGVDKDSLVSKDRESFYGPGTYKAYRMDNPYIFDQISTVTQMALKRAFVGCVRIATQTSGDFADIDVSSNGAGGSSGGSTDKGTQAPRKEKTRGKSEGRVVSAEVQKLEDDLYGHFVGDEEAVEKFLQETLKASGKIPLEKLPAAKLDRIREALNEKKAEKKDDDELPF